jgi:protein O-mannosyl-transferase
MKKQKRQRATEAQLQEPAIAVKPRSWWPWLAGVIGFLVALQAYGPALDGAFVLDDRSAQFMDPNMMGKPFWQWIGTNRPLLAFTYWINFQLSESNPASYHFLNVFLHTLGAAVFALIAARFLSWANVSWATLDGRVRDALAVFAGALFLLHPLQTESVAYVSSRSEVLSVLLFLSAFAVWLYAADESVSLGRSIVIVLLFGLAVLTKEHTAMLPFLVILTDIFWHRGGIRRNKFLYGLFVVGAAFGSFIVFRVLGSATTAGFNIPGLSPATYFFTECRVIWNYARMFVIPVGLNADPDIALSHSLVEHGAIFGLIALLGVLAAAWIYRNRFPLASFGVFTTILLLAPTSSFLPIADVQAERRVYLPFLGLALIALECLRRLKYKQLLGVAGVLIAICAVLTYQRSAVWAGPLPLWTDTVAKSPKKVRPRFQLAYAYYDEGQCPAAVGHFETAAQLARPTYDLLTDWALALDCAGKTKDAIAKAEEAKNIEYNAHVHALLGMLYAKAGDNQTALTNLTTAEQLDPRFEMTYVYKGNIAERSGDRAEAAQEYRRALAINPYNTPAQQGLTRLSQARVTR